MEPMNDPSYYTYTPKAVAVFGQYAEHLLAGEVNAFLATLTLCQADYAYFQMTSTPTKEGVYHAILVTYPAASPTDDDAPSTDGEGGDA